MASELGATFAVRVCLLAGNRMGALTYKMWHLYGDRPGGEASQFSEPSAIVAQIHHALSGASSCGPHSSTVSSSMLLAPANVPTTTGVGDNSASATSFSSFTTTAPTTVSTSASISAPSTMWISDEWDERRGSCSRESR